MSAGRVFQREVWWIDFPDPSGSEPGFRRPALVIQSDELNRSQLATVLCVPLTSNLRWADVPCNVALPASSTGLPKESVAQVAACVAVDRRLLLEPVGRIRERELMQVLNGLDMVVGRA